jgi:hypothetical protein
MLTGLRQEYLKRGDHLKEVGILDRVQSSVSYRKRMGGYILHSSGSVYGPVAGSCEHGNETSGSIN